ncbi:adhesion G protein-coupled receptor E5-like isoform X3 [Oncorhynchus tshawytscha]|uniref:adhesion G protein-coupled receptor E5-like isoform X3 n=1 Tax=Oncorhynchus tshawytscha TaxID=74940 RepID=UPI001C3C95AC|nr:adhesion G protein-coupled receptor E5-like isoform X3 [Oncorhynchus tshawytscha]
MGSRTLLLVLGLHFTLLGYLEAIDCGLGFMVKERQQCVDTDECKEWDSTPPCGSNATCYNTQGSFHCQCQPGFISTKTFKFTPPTGECNDLNECQDTPQVCGSNAACLNTIGSYYCQCKPGFRSTTTVNYTALTGECKDMDECKEQTADCPNNSSCVNTPGSYICICQSGYKLTESRCEDMDECKEQTADCPNNSSCVNTPGSYICICQSGYKLTESRCEDIDECNVTAGICGGGGTCQNQEGSYSCLCLAGYSNHGNKQARCSVLTCDQFKGDETPGQNVPGLAGLLSLMRNSCLALNNSGDAARGRLTGDGLLENVFTQIDSFLSQGILSNSREVSRFLGAVEDAMKLIAPQLRNNHTTMGTDHTEAEIAVRRGQTPPIGPISLANDNARLDTSWETATGNGTYPGLTLAGLVCYKGVERYVNDSFQYLTDTDTDTDTATATASEPNYQISSKVVTAFVSNPATEQLTKPVILTFRHLQVRAESSEMNYSCVFWRVHEEGGAWSRSGCTKVTSNATHTVCSCSHLSSFAVLMALYPVKDTFELRLLTWLGLSVSVVCLLLCILTFWLCRSIQGTRTTIHLHLCVCLFIADLVFLSGISHTQSKGGCRFVAGLLHLFFLGSFSWMLLEGVQLYRMVVLVFNTTIKPLYLHAVGYGLPLTIVIISAVTYPDGYGTTQHCWLSLERGFIWSFFGPVCTIIFLNAFIFIITVWRLAQKFSSLNPDLSNLHKIKVFTVTAVAQLCVLGTMWIFGVFQFQEEGTVVMTYLFTILNSLQGALLFIMHCLLNRTVREEYCKLLSCICTPQKKRYSDFSTNTPSSSQSQGSRRTQRTQGSCRHDDITNPP